MHHDLVDVLIIEDESELARLHAELIQKHPRMRLAGTAASLAQARQRLNARPPQLVLLDNYLPDGKGVTLMNDPIMAQANCSVIFITAASDMETCSLAIRNGAFDYILKPVSWKRLSQSLERFVQFYDQQREWKIVDQQNVDSLYQLQAKNYRADSVCTAAPPAHRDASPARERPVVQKPRCSLISSQAFWISCAFCLAISIISGGSPFATSLSGWCSLISLR